MPTPNHLLASFVTSWAGKVVSSTVQNWLMGSHFWHNIHGVPWHSQVLLCTATSGLTKVVPQSLKQPQRPPVTLEHMHALVHLLDLTNAFNVSVLAVASTTFWSCCRLGELLIDSVNSFNPTHHITCNAPSHHSCTLTGISYIVLKILWTKMSHGEGASIIASSSVDDPSNPVSAIIYHLSTNASVPGTVHLAPIHFPFFSHHCITSRLLIAAVAR